jgi:hypothetical protein
VDAIINSMVPCEPFKLSALVSLSYYVQVTIRPLLYDPRKSRYQKMKPFSRNERSHGNQYRGALRQSETAASLGLLHRSKAFQVNAVSYHYALVEWKAHLNHSIAQRRTNSYAPYDAAQGPTNQGANQTKHWK